jgi:hypothetical protein
MALIAAGRGLFSFRLQDNGVVSLKFGSAPYRLVGMAPDDFPQVVPAAQANWIRFEAKTLREMLAATSFAISHDETRYALNGETHGSWPGGADWAETSASPRRSPFRWSHRHSVGTPPKQSTDERPCDAANGRATVRAP